MDKLKAIGRFLFAATPSYRRPATFASLGFLGGLATRFWF